ncbi:hypothetical protein OH76DRAFT_951731 [Lentinus brumalis]|uniref:Uncharacterized protein n=1 Tax=Lentinus brumalis TaxID=2498619 RepID=A0A371CYS6_9APHY|nr:hypothetical protein OH76DRAFT_951731 [Polyporus brumalis]
MYSTGEQACDGIPVHAFSTVIVTLAERTESGHGGNILAPDIGRRAPHHPFSPVECPRDSFFSAGRARGQEGLQTDCTACYNPSSSSTKFSPGETAAMPGYARRAVSAHGDAYSPALTTKEPIATDNRTRVSYHSFGSGIPDDVGYTRLQQKGQGIAFLCRWCRGPAQSWVQTGR